MFSFVFATKSVVLAAASFSQLKSGKAYADRLSAQFCQHVIAYGCTGDELALVESSLGNKTEDTDLAQFKAKPAPTKVAVQVSSREFIEAAAAVGDPIAMAKVEPCMKCGGSGTYQWSWDGKGFRFSGTCFDCKGKGHMDKADAKRDAYYHNHIERLDFAH